MYISSLIAKVKNAQFIANNKHAITENYFIHKHGEFTKKTEYAVVLHLYYLDNWNDVFKAKLLKLSKTIPFDLYITMPESNTAFIDTIRETFSYANILVVPNKGRDVLPFIKTALLLDQMGYQKVLKMHSKKSTHRDNEGNSAESGNSWLQRTVNALIPDDSKTLEQIAQKLEDKNTGMIGPQEYYYPIKMYLKKNRSLVRQIIDPVDSTIFSGLVAPKLDEIGFFGGTMFWANLDSIREGLAISHKNFPAESGQTDGTLAHALERVFCILPQIKGNAMYGVSRSGVTKVTKGTYPQFYFDDVSGGLPRVSIVVPVYADWSSLSKNISSLKKHYAHSEEVAVYYVNDCGPDVDDIEAKIIEQINDMTNFYYDRNEHNLGFVKTCNRAALQITPQEDDVLLLNSDTKTTKDFVINMKRVLYSEDKIGAVTARSNNATIWSVPMTGRLANHRVSAYVLYRLIRHQLPDKYITPTIHGFCVLIRRSVISKYKLFDEIYGKGYGEENDFAMRIRSHGWKTAAANKAFVFHYESRSFGKVERNIQIEKNEKILLERYPDYRQLIQEYWDSIKEPLK